MYHSKTEYPNTFIATVWHGESLNEELAIGIVAFKPKAGGGFYGFCTTRKMEAISDVEGEEIPIQAFGIDY